jgi:hypothetical protein
LAAQWWAAKRLGYNLVLTRAQPRISPIDIIFLIERLEALITNGRRMPMTNSVVVDQTVALDLIDQLRVAVPEEVREAKRINDETTRLVERAQEEAERILARAQEQAAFLIEERELTRAAEERSVQIVATGRETAEEIQRGADAYAQSVLVRLEGECVKALQTIRRGLAMLDERHPEAANQQNGNGTLDQVKELTPENPVHAQL